MDSGCAGGDLHPLGFSHLPQVPVIPQDNGFPPRNELFLLSSIFSTKFKAQTSLCQQQALAQYSQEVLPSWDLKVGGRMWKESLENWTNWDL